MATDAPLVRAGDFRSWTRADIEFDPGPSVLVGANGQGKTNLVEARALGPGCYS